MERITSKPSQNLDYHPESVLLSRAVPGADPGGTRTSSSHRDHTEATPSSGQGSKTGEPGHDQCRKAVALCTVGPESVADYQLRKLQKPLVLRPMAVLGYGPSDRRMCNASGVGALLPKKILAILFRDGPHFGSLIFYRSLKSAVPAGSLNSALRCEGKINPRQLAFGAPDPIGDKRRH